MKKVKHTDYWQTPKALFETLDNEFNFVADMAANKANALCSHYYDEEDNSLELDWKQRIFNIYPDGQNWVWCNPPYSNPKPWVEKAIESQANGLGVVMLLNADTSTEWFYKALAGVSEIRNVIGYRQGGKFKNGRIQFCSASLKPSSNNKAQIILVFDPLKIGANVTKYVSRNELMA